MIEKIGAGLIRIGAMTSIQAEEVLQRQRAGDNRLFGEIAIELGYINDKALESYLNVKTGCRFLQDCHFNNIKNKTPQNLRLKEIYCDGLPKNCAIYQYKEKRKPVPITLWPTGKLMI